jgi:hypothetical protein
VKTYGRSLGYVVFRLMRNADGDLVVHEGEVTTTRREYLQPDGNWTWDVNRAARYVEDDWIEDGKGGMALHAKHVAETASRACGEECHVALLYPSRKSEQESVAATAAAKRSEAAGRAAETRRARDF